MTTLTDRGLVLTPNRQRRLKAWEQQEADRLERIVRAHIDVYVAAEQEAIARLVEREGHAELAEQIRARIDQDSAGLKPVEAVRG